MTGRLTELWRLGPSEVICAVGAGGKSSLLERLALDYEAEGSRVLLTSTTKMLPPSPGDRPLVVAGSLEGLLASLARRPDKSPVVGREVSAEGKLLGIPTQWVSVLRDLPWVQAVLVEGDGATGLPLKAPAPWEPVVPSATTLLVAVAGLEAQGAFLEEGQVHRPDRLAELLKLPPGARVAPPAVLEALLLGYLPYRPPAAAFLAFLNKADLREPLAELVEAGRHATVDCWAGSVRSRHYFPLANGVSEVRPAALVLAAGLGTRMQGEKLLARLGERTVLGHVLAAAGEHPGLAEVILVGPASERMERLVQSELLRPRHSPAEVELAHGRPAPGARTPSGVRIVSNPHPEEGQASSLRRGLSELTRPRDLLVLLGDQPFVTAGTIDRLLLARASSPRTAAVGLVEARAARQSLTGSGAHVRPPLIIHRALLPRLLELEGDQGARSLLARYSGQVVGVPAENAELMDVDTAYDLERARRLLAGDLGSRSGAG